MHKVLSLLLILLMSTSLLNAQDTIVTPLQDTTPILNENIMPQIDSISLINDIPNSIEDTNTYILISDSNATEPTYTDPSSNNIVLEEDTTKRTPYLHPIAQARLKSDSLSQQLQFYVHKLDSCNAIYEALFIQYDSLQDKLDFTTKRYNAVTHLRDSLVITNERYQKELRNTNSLLEDQVKAMTEKEKLLEEKEALYRDAITNSTIDKTKLESELASKNTSIDAKAREISYLQQDIDNKAQTLHAQKEDYERLAKERDRYIHIVDSLRAMVRTAELENVRKDEANKYLAQRAKEAEEKVAQATSRKRKVRPIQGIAMRLFRTPDWEILLTPNPESGEYEKTIRNRNAGNVEFDFVTGASVMLWDLTKYFNPAAELDTLSKKHAIPNFDQQFSYDLGLYVGFGGSNIFKNFYIAPSFRFVDFFYLTIGINICEYELLDDGYEPGDTIDKSLTLDNITSKVWKVKPFIAFNIDLDFLSYIKK